ncbi:hypothetical protein C9374_013854 [Naegleria lovaniensis]|uniref:F-box domain-containing protein n=1 Tax=Naegleria lovaniensis TaxID=51637 RepID=A0AA88H0H8_NAELO|nr:uncharacterized protein C9374_013854 [Naegleria lovaniensis]KAG2389294.1 hypothetical protein C9374_013854 [Naegleria lovaniensis]
MYFVRSFFKNLLSPKSYTCKGKTKLICRFNHLIKPKNQYVDQRQKSSSHIFKEIPIELFACIASYFDLNELFNMGLCDQYLLKLLFNLSPQKVSELIKQKSKMKKKSKKSMAFEEKEASLWKEADSTLVTPLSKDDFDLIQTKVWRTLVQHYFPFFDMNLNIQNWMQVVRIRVTRLRKYTYLTLNQVSVQPQPKTFLNEKNEPLPISIDEDTQYETPFIENCDLVYECPVVSELFSTSRYAESVHCHKCNKKVLFITSLSQFKALIGTEQCVAFNQPYGACGGFCGGLI